MHIFLGLYFFLNQKIKLFRFIFSKTDGAVATIGGHVTSGKQIPMDIFKTRNVKLQSSTLSVKPSCREMTLLDINFTQELSCVMTFEVTLNGMRAKI